MTFIDTHTHLQYKDFNLDLSEVISRAKAAGVHQIVTLGTDLSTSKIALEIANNYEGVFMAAGIHPSDAHLAQPGDIDKIQSLIQKNLKAVAVGEIGLDFYWETKHFQAQYDIFGEMLRLGKRLNKPVVIHNRSAEREMPWFFQTEKFDQVNGVMHCFAGDVQDAKFYLDMGLHISFTANITFKNFANTDVLKYVPLDRVMIETDSPFMAPKDYKTKRNEPAYVVKVAEELAKVHQKDIAEIAQITTENAQNFFSLPCK